MDDSQRLQLKKMIEVNNTQDNTENIRRLKHSNKLIEDIRTLQQLKFKHKGDLEKVQEDATNMCSFLHTNYTDIYNKVKNDEIDLPLLNQFLNVLQRIENNEMDQHEASYMIGSILKEIYIDSALKKADKLDQQRAAAAAVPTAVVNKVSWKEYKAIQQKSDKNE
jgi:hypothetical protein|uniref:Uncharacterized protein n=1 Tax=viral metagenome TaxID=1070528 RepID=A0A6C0IKB1_9ZZZZ